MHSSGYVISQQYPLKSLSSISEIAAVIKANATIPTFWPMIIKTDSMYVIEGLTKHLADWENRGWIGIKNGNFFRKAAYLLRRQTAPTLFNWVKGHNGDVGNEQSDRLAKEGANKEEPDDIPLEIPHKYDLQGAKLATMTQALAYSGIRAQLPTPIRPTTNRNLELTKNAIKELTTTHETSNAIWKGIRKRTIRPRVQQFLFKSLHGAYRVGNFWLNIPGYEERGQCPRCSTTKSMEHILTSCTTEPVSKIWALARENWPHEPESWPVISIGTILGCGNINPPRSN